MSYLEIKLVKAPHPKNKRFNHVCSHLRLCYPEDWNDVLGVDAGGHWTLRSPSLEFEVFYCPFCGRNLNEVFSAWTRAGLWKK